MGGSVNIEKCTTCNQAIGIHETACLYNGNVVCQDCDARLRGQQIADVGLVKVKGTLNTLVIIVSVLGLLVSAVFHFGSLLGFLSPPPLASRWLTGGFLILFTSWNLVSNQPGKKADKKAFNQLILKHTPKGIGAMAGILFLYTLFGFGFFVISKYVSTSPIAVNAGLPKNTIHCFPSYCMALYAFTLSLSCAYRVYVKSREKAMKS